MRKCVVYTLTRNYYDKMIPSLKSLLAHTHIDTIYVLAEDDELPLDLPREVKERMKVINISGQQYFRENGPNYANMWSYIVLIRGAMAKLITDADLVLNIDADTIVYDDISPLWDYDMTGYYMAGVREIRLSQLRCHLYVNFGVTMLNLKELREPGPDGRCKADELIWWINNVKVVYVEQDTYNKLCKDHVLEWPSDYNYTKWKHVTVPTDHIAIRHYAGEGDWWEKPEVQEWRNRPWVVK